MITKEQIEALSKHYRIDEFSIVREYLQLILLSHLYQHKKSGEISFKGGTALRLLYQSSRFSEDLDFTSEYDKKTIGKIITDVEKSIQTELPELNISIFYSGKNGIRYRIKYKTDDFKFPFVIRLDISSGKRFTPGETTPIISQYPIVNFPIVVHLSQEEIFAEKIRALLGRSKGRDLYDAWYLFGKGVIFDQKLIREKMKEIGRVYSKELLLKKVKNFSDRQIKQDLAQFLPVSQKKAIPMIKTKLNEYIEKYQFPKIRERDK